MFTQLDDSNLDGLAIQKIAVVHPAQNELTTSTRGYVANNVYPGFPPLMNDGRSLIASWQPEAVENNRLLKSSGVNSNWEYRRYLTQNAHSILQHNFVEAANDCGYYNLDERYGNNSAYLPIFAGLPKSAGQPAKYNSYIQPEHTFGKMASDLKANYLSREQLSARSVTPVVTQADLLNYGQK